MKTQAKIQKWGNSLGLRISGPMKTIPHFTENMTVIVDITEKGITVSPMPKKIVKILPFTEEELLRGLNTYTGHTDEILELKLLPKEYDV